MNRKPLILLLLSVTVLAVVSCGPPRTHEGTAIRLNDFELLELNGAPVNLSALSGKQVVVNIWATWCKPCIQELPSFRAAQDKLKDKDIIFLFASDEPMDLIKKFEAKRQTGLPLVRLENYKDFNFQAIPVTFVFNGSGQLTHYETGSRDWQSEASMALLTKSTPLE